MLNKGNSPFYPGQPVPPELFVGREKEVERIMIRGAKQTANGKPTSFFIRGEYGIGKSSLARYIQKLADEEFGVHPIYVSLGSAQNMDDFSHAVVEATAKFSVYDRDKKELILKWFSDYVSKVSLFGVTINTKQLKEDAPYLGSPMDFISFIDEVRKQLNVNSVCIVLDELNGLATNPQFAGFLKGLSDINHEPIMLMVCGVPQRRVELLQCNPSLDRIFDIVDIDLMSREETEDFFVNSFKEVDIEVEPKALSWMVDATSGYPKIAHIIGNEVYINDENGVVSEGDAMGAVIKATVQFGKMFVNEQILKAIHSPHYVSILDEIIHQATLIGDEFKWENLTPTYSFLRTNIIKKLSDTEKRKFDNFVKRMKELNVLSSVGRGEYVFKQPMVAFYIALQLLSERKEDETQEAS